MRATVDLLRNEPAARRFFLAHAQSQLGTGAGYVVLLLIAADRFASPWAITLILLADFLPAMALGPIFGAAADRWSRRWCAVAADVLRAAAFVGIALVDGFGATLALALVAGAGSGLFTPAVLAGLPSLVSRERLPAGTSLYGALSDVGHTLGPAVAAGTLLVASPEAVCIANGLTFALSALLIVGLRFGERRVEARAQSGLGASLLADARRGLVATARMPGVRALVLAGSAVGLFAGMLNVGELFLAKSELGVGSSAFSALVAVYGAGVIVGSLASSKGGSLPELKRRFMLGLLLVAAGLAGSALAPVYASALVTFAVCGVGNGLILVNERLLLQAVVPDGLMGRVFGVRDTLGAWAFALAFILAGGVLVVMDTRAVFALAGAGAFAVLALAILTLRRTWTEDTGPAAPPAVRAARAPAVAPAAES